MLRWLSGDPKMNNPHPPSTTTLPSKSRASTSGRALTTPKSAPSTTPSPIKECSCSAASRFRRRNWMIWLGSCLVRVSPPSRQDRERYLGALLKPPPPPRGARPPEADHSCGGRNPSLLKTHLPPRAGIHPSPPSTELEAHVRALHARGPLFLSPPLP